MCRIIGGINVSKEWVDQGLAHMKKGGPDNTGTHQIGNVIFGHNRLSIIDLSNASNQPIVNGQKMMVYNGEWYDYYIHSGYNSDSWALFRNLCLNRVNEYSIGDINGMFAFAHYEGDTSKIYLAVDRFGQKPLYYFHEGDTFAFASAPAALYSLKNKWELDRDALQSYWLLGSVMGENGIFKGIKKLCASEYIVYDIESNTYEVKRYWEPKYVKCSQNDLEDMVIDAIRKVKVSDVPVHVFLSGGIDSTLVASQFEGGKAIHLDGPERPFAEQAAKRFHVELNVIDPQDTDTEEALTDYVTQCGEPTMAGIIPWIVSRETAKYGKVAISANGADELFFGYDRTHDDFTEQQMNHTFRNIKRPQFTNQPTFPFYTYFNNKSSGRMWELGGYVQFDLNKTLDFASMCHGLEVRSPFLDHRLVEMALSIPESEHRAKGNKTILKRMLRNMEFGDRFLDRPKQGFSLFKQPKRIDYWVSLAWNWVQKEGFLDLEGKVLNGRDQHYLKMSALGFYFWHRVWKHKIQ